MAQKQIPKKEQLIVILDSNAFFVPLQFKIDIFAELKGLLNRNFELVLLPPVRMELERLAETGSPKTAKNASYALKIAEKCKFVEVDVRTFASVDDAIVEKAREWNCMVFTNDRALKKRLRNINVPVIYVRQKSRLGIDGRL
jgi:rRNA-processing protein FCF1